MGSLAAGPASGLWGKRQFRYAAAALQHRPIMETALCQFGLSQRGSQLSPMNAEAQVTRHYQELGMGWATGIEPATS